MRQLLATLKMAQDDALAVFLAKGKEVGLDATVASLLERGQCVVAPISGGAASFYTLSSGTGGTLIGAWGVREPVQSPNGRAYQPDEIKVILWCRAWPLTLTAAG